MAFDTAEVIAEKLSQIHIDNQSGRRPSAGHIKALPGDRTYDGYGQKENFVPTDLFAEESSEDPQKGEELWRDEDVILKTKTAIFDEHSKLKGIIAPQVSEFVQQRYFADTKEEALKKVQDNDLGKSASQFLIASEFLHFLKDKKRWDVVGQINRKSQTISKPEIKKIEKHDSEKANSLNLKLNRRRIESHFEPDLIKHVDRFVAVLGSGAVTKVQVDTKRGAVSRIKLFYNRNDGPQSVYLSTENLHNAIDGLNYYRDSRISDPTGLSYIDNDGDMLVLNPKTTDSEAKEFFSQISIDGKKLTGDFEVVVNKS